MQENLYTVEAPSIEYHYSLERIALFGDAEIMSALERANDEYLHWEKLKYKTWLPSKISKEEFWAFLKMNRLFNAKPTAIKEESGLTFKMNTSRYDKFLHTVDMEMAGNFMGITDFSENDKREYISRNMIEESIASSQLEGANTSRLVAKKMLLEGRKPKTNGEQMILNNHKAMQKIEQGLFKQDLTWELICELHAMITDQILPNDKQNKLRETLDEKGNRLVIKLPENEKIAYIAPDKKFVETELPKLIAFANDKELDDKTFTHPLIKAIMLHFWIGLLHPFEDGNGRLARILFYWYMLRKNYWAFAYISLSEKIKKSPIQYAMAYIYSEQDDCDLTYFINYNVRKLKLARKEFQHYILNKVKENRLVISLTQEEHNLNERQIKLLQFFNRKTDTRINLLAYQKLYSIKKVTASYDLKKLVAAKFLIKKRHGRNIFYYPTEEINKLFKFK